MPPHSLNSSSTADMPELPPMPSKQTGGLGPLDPPYSLDNDQETIYSEPAKENPTPISIPKSSSPKDLDMELDEELSRSVSTVESWLKRSNSDMEVSALAVPPSSCSSTSTATTNHALSSSDSTAISSMTRTTPAMSSKSTAFRTASDSSEPPAVLDLRRPSHTSISTNEEDNNSESEDIKVPIAVLTMGSNRLSRMYENQSMQLSEELNLQGGSTSSAIKPTRNSIRFSQYGLLLSKDLPLAASSTSSSLGFTRPDKPLPRRPASLFMSPSNLALTLMESKEETTQETETDDNQDFHNSNQLLRVASIYHGVHGAARPATICIGAEDANNIAVTTASLSSASTAAPASPVTVTIKPLSSHVSVIPAHTPAPILALTPAPSSSPDTPETPVLQKEETLDSLASKAAKRCWAEDETFLKRDEISPYLGAGSKPFNRLVLAFYMRHFNFSGKRLDAAFRQLCHKLMLRGETQEVDRVLEEFAARFVECNPESIFGHKDIVHAITYSILLLNTDLHVVQQSSANKMSRSAFVKNTLQVVLAQTEYREQQERQSEDSSSHGLTLTSAGGELSVHGSGPGGKRRTPSVKSWKSGASHQSKSSKMGLDPKANGGHGNGKWWLQELEALLKDIYSTVKHHQILLPTTAPASGAVAPGALAMPVFSPPPTNSTARLGSGSGAGASRGYKPGYSNALIDVGFGGLGSGSGSFAGGGGSVVGTGASSGVLGLVRRNSTNARTKQLRQEAMQRLKTQERATTPEDDSSIHHGFAPSVSVSDSTRAPKMHGGISSRALTPPLSSSMVHHPSNVAPLELPAPAPRALSQHNAHQKQQSHENGIYSHCRFRKEGILFRKHLLERPDKKASNRSWRQLLVVLDQGGLSLFRADGSLGQAYEDQGILFDEIRLQHTITNVLPPPGYSSSRRHVFAIQLFTGAVYLFQAATAVECEEWARTCNYWAAKTTKEPLSGGVINMDYGWGRSLDMFQQQQQQQQQQLEVGLIGNNGSSQSMMMLSGNSSGSSLTALATTTPSSSSNISLEDNEDAKSLNSSVNAGISFLNHPPPSSGGSINGSGSIYGNSGVGSGRSASIKSSSSRHHPFGSNASSNNVPLGDRVVLFEWSAPLPTMSMSTLTEKDQCEALKRYIAGLESDMEQHQEHRIPMMSLFLPKSNNYNKAFNNWERRSRHLLKEMVKYQIYVESLEQSLALQREEKRVEEQEIAHVETELQHLEVNDDDGEEDEEGEEHGHGRSEVHVVEYVVEQEDSEHGTI
ncbi:hypothetical protein BGX28_006044 [Mortierella sp. GBA30]|nr:hypothetical protein BGX28_006044 [Mortierella sp. GBA30]